MENFQIVEGQRQKQKEGRSQVSSILDDYEKILNKLVLILSEFVRLFKICSIGLIYGME